MIVNEFENTKEYRLKQIVSTLKNIHSYELDLGSKSDEQIQSLHETCEIVKNSIVKESRFNTWMQNPEYTKNMLIMEAIRIYLTEIAPKRMNRSRKIKENHELNEVDPGAMVDMHELGSRMMDYSQSQKPRGDDDREMRILNAISDVGDKLTRLGTPFGPKTLTDMDRKVIEVAKRRMGMKNSPDTAPSLMGLSETGAQPAPAIPGKPAAVSNVKPGMITMKKNNQTQEVNADQAKITNMRKQGWNVVADVDEARDSQEFSPELLALMKEYGVDGVDEGDKFSGERQAAIDAGENKFTVDGKTYPVTGKKTPSDIDEDWGSSDWTAAINYMDDYLKGQRINPDTIRDAAMATAEFYHDMMGYDSVEDAQDRIIHMWMRRKGWDKLLGMKEGHQLNEAMHMEHDNHQADMARSELYRNTKYAMDMMKMIGPHDDVKPWILAGLTKAANYLDKIYHYMDYHATFKSESEPVDKSIDENDEDVAETTGGAARQNLLMVIEYSTKLFRMIQPGDKLEGWVAMKLTTASECISSAKHYLDYAQFEKHIGDEIADIDQDVVAMKEDKKKVVKEGRLVTIGNILMREMIKEEQDLEQAQTLLAAKSMSDELQGMAEKLAKMSVEDLMPLVDTMKEQFGQDIANGFNGVLKSSLEAALNSMTSAKESTDNAILSMQQGQVPGTAADIETTEPPALDSEEEAEDEFETVPAAAGEKNEPLGRKKKEVQKDQDLVDIEESITEAKKTKVSVLFYFPFNVSTYQKIEDKIEKAAGIDSDGSGTDFKMRDISFTFKNKEDAKKAIAAVKALKIQGLKHKLNEGLIGEAKKAVEPGAVATAQVMKMKGKYVTKDGKHLTKAGIKKRDEIIRAIEKEQKLTESEPVPGKYSGTFYDVTEEPNGDYKIAKITKKVDSNTKKNNPLNLKVGDIVPKGKANQLQYSHDGGMFDVLKNKINESMDNFIVNNKQAFKARHGANWETKLYETAWLKFGEKSRDFERSRLMLESARKTKQVLEKAFEVHKAKYARMVNEGAATDVLNTGYGLEGQNILDQISDTNSMIDRLAKLIRSEISNGVAKMFESKELTKRSARLETIKNSTPYGVVWTANGRTNKKFFESADLRKYWMELNSDMLSEHKLVEPSDFDKKIQKLKV